MATINPSFGPVGSTPAQAPAPRIRPDAEATQAPLGDGLNIDFSKASVAAPVVEEKSVAPKPEVTVETLVAPSLGGIQAAAAEGGFSLSSTGGLACLESVPLSALIGDSPSIDGCLAKLAGPGEINTMKQAVATILATDVKWDLGAEVVSNAQKFVIPVPKCEGEPLVYPQTYPEGAVDKDGQSIAGQPTRDKDGKPMIYPEFYEKGAVDPDGNSLEGKPHPDAGKPKPIVDWQGQPIGDKGLVFFNRKDQAFQAVKSDGEGVVIMNQINEAQGKKLQDKVTSLTGGDPSKLTLDQFKEVLNYATSPEVGWEKPDMYNSDRGFISKKMNPLETQTTGIPQYGLFRRDDRDVCRALLAEGPSEFEAPTTGGITVKQPIPEEGGVLVRQPDGKVWLYRKVDIEAMEETYTHKDGSKLNVSELPKHQV